MNSTNRRIIIFDDDEDIVSICRYILEENGWEVHSFTDCTIAVEKVQDIMPDIILMNNWIPDEGGIVTTQQLKRSAALKDIPVIYFSANSDIEALTQIAGAEAFLAKPFNLEDLERVIEANVRKDRPELIMGL